LLQKNIQTIEQLNRMVEIDETERLMQQALLVEDDEVADEMDEL
jgi:hypothetical protein